MNFDNNNNNNDDDNNNNDDDNNDNNNNNNKCFMTFLDQPMCSAVVPSAFRVSRRSLHVERGGDESNFKSNQVCLYKEDSIYLIDINKTITLEQTLNMLFNVPVKIKIFDQREQMFVQFLFIETGRILDFQQFLYFNDRFRGNLLPAAIL